MARVLIFNEFQNFEKKNGKAASTRTFGSHGKTESVVFDRPQYKLYVLLTSTLGVMPLMVAVSESAYFVLAKFSNVLTREI